MNTPYRTFFILVALVFSAYRLTAQQSEAEKRDYGFQITEMSIPKLAPDGYESVKTVALRKPLYPGKAYEVGFWIFGPQLPDRGYSFPLQVFPSNFMGAVNREIFKLVEANEIMPKLAVSPPPSYTSRGHFTFVIRPDTLYNYVTVALKVANWERPPIDLRNDITVTGVFVRPVPNTIKKELKTTIKEPTPILKTSKEKLPETLAERLLIDSEKSYTVADSEISIGLYDHRNIDRDRVTIYLNEQIITKNYELKRKKKFFEAQLRPGKNTITLHAENLGEVSPNTAAIVIKSNSKEFRAVLESDLGTSQYFTLVYEN